MSEQNVEGHVEPNRQANGQVSDGQTLSQEASNTEVNLRAELDVLKSEIRGLQGKMDKDAKAVEDRLMGRFEMVAGKLGMNLTPEQKMNLRVMELEEQLASVGQGVAKPQSQTVQEPQEPVNIANIKAAYPEIDFNDPTVMNIVAQNIFDETAILAGLGKVKMTSVNKPKPTSASVVSPAGTTQPVSSVKEAQDRINAILGDRDKLLTREGRAELAAARAKLQEIE